MGTVGAGTRGGLRTAKRVIDAPMERLEDFGHQMAFYVRAFAWVWRVIVRYKNKEHRKLMNAVLKRDVDTACVLLSDHIQGTQRNVEAALKRLEAGAA